LTETKQRDSKLNINADAACVILLCNRDNNATVTTVWVNETLPAKGFLAYPLQA
jgi:hypothetical protein